MPVPVALGLVLGANIGSGMLAMLATANASPQVRRLPLGNLIFKLLGAVLFIVFLPQVHILLQQVAADGAPAGRRLPPRSSTSCWRVVFIGFTGLVGRTVDRWLADPQPGAGTPAAAPPRPAGAQHAVARDLLRGARGAAPGRRRRDDAARHPAGAAQERPAALGRAAQARRHGRRALFGDQVLPDPDLARGARRRRRAGAGPTSSRSRSTWSRSATSSSASSRTSRTR